MSKKHKAKRLKNQKKQQLKQLKRRRTGFIIVGAVVIVVIAVSIYFGFSGSEETEIVQETPTISTQVLNIESTIKTERSESVQSIKPVEEKTPAEPEPTQAPAQKPQPKQ